MNHAPYDCKKERRVLLYFLSSLVFCRVRVQKASNVLFFSALNGGFLDVEIIHPPKIFTTVLPVLLDEAMLVLRGFVHLRRTIESEIVLYVSIFYKKLVHTK